MGRRPSSFGWFHYSEKKACCTGTDTLFSGDSQNFQRYPPPRPTELPGIFGAKYDATEDPYASMFRDFVFPRRTDDEIMDDE